MKGAVGAVLVGAVGLLAACGGRATNPPPGGLTPGSDETATGAAKTIPTDNAEIYQSLEELFRGKVSGLEVIQADPCGFALRIRSPTPSLRGTDAVSPCDRQPLVVVDGQPIPPGTSVSDALLGLRPDQVDRIRVLKDVSSTAVYGTRGANGVVLITLKR